MRIVVWLVEGTWQGCLDAAAQVLPPDAQVTLLHVSPSDVAAVTDAANAGLLGRVAVTGPPAISTKLRTRRPRASSKRRHSGSGKRERSCSI